MGHIFWKAHTAFSFGGEYQPQFQKEKKLLCIVVNKCRI